MQDKRTEAVKRFTHIVAVFNSLDVFGDAAERQMYVDAKASIRATAHFPGESAHDSSRMEEPFYLPERKDIVYNGTEIVRLVDKAHNIVIEAPYRELVKVLNDYSIKCTEMEVVPNFRLYVVRNGKISRIRPVKGHFSGYPIR